MENFGSKSWELQIHIKLKEIIFFDMPSSRYSTQSSAETTSAVWKTERESSRNTAHLLEVPANMAVCRGKYFKLYFSQLGPYLVNYEVTKQTHYSLYNEALLKSCIVLAKSSSESR